MVCNQEIVEKASADIYEITLTVLKVLLIDERFSVHPFSNKLKICGNGFKRILRHGQSQAEAIFEVGEWTEIALDPELVQALVDEEQYGIVVWQPSWAINLDIAPIEEGDGAHAASLIVHASGAAAEPYGKLASTWGGLK